jgi:hypothetical protein
MPVALLGVEAIVRHDEHQILHSARRVVTSAERPSVVRSEI